MFVCKFISYFKHLHLFDDTYINLNNRSLALKQKYFGYFLIVITSWLDAVIAHKNVLQSFNPSYHVIIRSHQTRPRSAIHQPDSYRNHTNQSINLKNTHNTTFIFNIWAPSWQKFSSDIDTRNAEDCMTRSVRSRLKKEVMSSNLQIKTCFSANKMTCLCTLWE